MGSGGSSARERILESAYELFSTHGVRAVGVDDVIVRAGVAKATLYRHFPSKDALVLAFLERRELVYTRGWIEAGARRRAATAQERLLAIFDLFDEWFRRDDFEGCSFVNLLLESTNRDGPVARACVGHLERIRDVIRTLAADAGLGDVDNFAHAFHLLMQGAVAHAEEGDADAAKRAQSMARDLIAKHYSSER
ncbi:MAG TPA: helix-turn-helix domain-containing protein [Gaiellaceae bacterium]|jgi:AcrR family transcriptional regulator|nr:helix-turn-helix domain-containing protein [Gaiellaceae bacterium]